MAAGRRRTRAEPHAQGAGPAYSAAMPRLDIAVSILSAVLAAATLVGLFVRGKVRACVLFPVYLASAALGHAVLVVFPALLWNWGFWASTDVVQTVLRLGIAFEVAIRTFRPLPRGSRHIRLLFFVITLAILVAVVVYPREVTDAFELTLVVGRISYGVAVMFTVFLLVVWYYGVPIDPLHRVVAAGFAVASALLAFAHVFTADYEWGRSLLTKTAYPIVLAVWAVSAWRRDSFAGLSPRSVGILWPWRKP